MEVYSIEELHNLIVNKEIDLDKYYLNQKEEALRDFYRHKRIVEKYLQDQATSEYKARYPVYTQKHLNNINKWIEATLER